jgi:ribosomal protein L40E
MEHTVKDIINNPENYKICKKCGALNWHNNKQCWQCKNKRFNKNKEEILKLAYENYHFVTEKEEYIEEEAQYVFLIIS